MSLPPIAVFVLRHLIEATQLVRGEAPLFCCFVDFRKAYDKVRRDKLMARLAQLGVHGHMLQAIVHMYWSVPLVPKLDGHLGPSIDSTCGVKQGDPLSPLLFGLFIDEFESWLKTRLPGIGVRMGTRLVQMLLYADDMVLMARNPGDLQLQLDLLHEFAVQQDMEVNVEKTEIVVFRKGSQPPSPQWQWQYNGAPIQVSREFRYLGIIFHETEGVKGAIQALTVSARRAMWGMMGRFRVARITDISMKLKMFASLVLPIMEYCGEVWGPSLIASSKNLADLWDNPLQRVQTLFLRQLGKLRKSVPTTILHREMCSDPVAKGWVRGSMALWGRLRAAPAGSLLGAAVRDSIALAQASNQGLRRTWAGQFFSMIRNMFVDRDPSGEVKQFADSWGSIAATGQLLPMPTRAAWEAWDNVVQDRWEELAGLNPRHALSDQVKMSTYGTWFAVPPLPAGQDSDDGYPGGMAEYIKHTGGLLFEHVKSLMRFRTGAHHLAIETGRWRNPPVPRDERLCTMCSQTVVEDELHVLVECAGYAQIRQKYSSQLFTLFGGIEATRRTLRRQPVKVAVFMNQEPKHVAGFIHECLEHRRNAEYDVLPYFSAEDWGGRVAGLFDTFSSDICEMSGDESSPSVAGGVLVDAHRAAVGPVRAPHFDGANL